MERGTIVLTKFPFTDLSASKRRPALIISKVSTEKPDVIVSFISSVIPENMSETDFVLDTNHKDFQGTGLRKKSVFKMDKLATLDKSIFTGELGSLPPDTLCELETRLKIALELKKVNLEMFKRLFKRRH